MSPLSLTLLKRLTGVAVACVFVSLLSTPQATASCGDYVTLQANQTVNRMMDDFTVTGRNPKRPCSGPNCTLRPSSVPVVPAVIPVNRIPDLVAIIVDSSEFDSLATIDWDRSLSQSLPTSRSILIFHPPRY